MPCFDAGGQARSAGRSAIRGPGSMRDGDWLVGWGCATTCYPTNMGAATAPRAADAARVGAGADGERTRSAPASMTALALTAASGLGVQLEQVQVEVGDSDLPPAPVAGGSNSTASICTVVAKACDQIRDQLALAAVGAPRTARSRAPTRRS